MTYYIHLLDVLQLTDDVPDLGLSAAQTGTIVNVTASRPGSRSRVKSARLLCAQKSLTL